jgi:hypothetical protein
MNPPDKNQHTWCLLEIVLDAEHPLRANTVGLGTENGVCHSWFSKYLWSPRDHVVPDDLDCPEVSKTELLSRSEA